jgi:dTDP-4-dehydrorhamnose reductase
LQRSLSPLGTINAVSRAGADFETPKVLIDIVRNSKPNVIINAAAFTAVDKAESESARVKQINTDSVAILAHEARSHNALLIHYSSDYVFDGKKHEPYTESDIANPLNVYGVSKLEAESAIAHGCYKYLIFRTSWLHSARGNNFIKTILNLSKFRNELNIVDDQLGSPTSAELVADVTLIALHSYLHLTPTDADRVFGLYHLTAQGATTWYEYGRFVLKSAQEMGMNYKLNINNLKPVSSVEYSSSAVRPSNSQLDCRKLQKTFGVNLPDWRQHVLRTVTELTGRGVI